MHKCLVKTEKTLNYRIPWFQASTGNLGLYPSWIRGAIYLFLKNVKYRSIPKHFLVIIKLHKTVNKTT